MRGAESFAARAGPSMRASSCKLVRGSTRGVCVRGKFTTIVAVTCAVLMGARGTSAWEVQLVGSAQGGFGADAVLLPTGDVVVAGSVQDLAPGLSQFAVSRLSGADGSPRWRLEIDGSGVEPPSEVHSDFANEIVADFAGDVIASG